MKRYGVVIPPIVQEQIRAQVLHIAQDSIDNALAWEDRLRSAIQSLGRLPGRHPVDEAASDRLGQTVHRLVFEQTYLVHYLVNDELAAIEIVNFRHGARLPRVGEP